LYISKKSCNFAAKIYYNILFMEILTQIKSRRMALGIKQEDLAEMADVSLATVKDMDRGVGNPSLKTLLKIANVLGVELVLQIRQ